MSKAAASNVETIWTKIENSPLDLADAGGDTTTLIVGDSGCGKTSIINNTFKAASNKQPKTTFALEYTFARKKASGSGANAAKSVANIWELGGGINEPRLLHIPLTARNINSAVLVVCVDLSKPQNVALSLRRWIDGLKDLVVRALGDSQCSSLRETARARFSEGPDQAKVAPFPVPIYIVGTKYDLFRNIPTAERKAVLQIIRFYAHYYGASLFCTSGSDATLRDSFKAIFGAMCFNSALKNFSEFSPEKPISVSSGKDSFADILAMSQSESSVKSRLVYTEADVSKLIGAAGEAMPRGCWTRIEEHSTAMFGPPDSDLAAAATGTAAAGTAEYGTNASEAESNDFPEPEIDSKRLEKDAELAKYVQDAERREALQARMQSDSAGAGTEIDGGDYGIAAAAGDRRSKGETDGDAPRERRRQAASSDGQEESKSSRKSKK